MKKLLLLGTIAAGLFAASSQARAGISFSISLGNDHHHHRPRVVVAPPPVVVAPPVVAYSGHCAPPIVAYPQHCAPAPRYVYRGYDRHYAPSHYGRGGDWRGHEHGLRFEPPRGAYAMNVPRGY